MSRKTKSLLKKLERYNIDAYSTGIWGEPRAFSVSNPNGEYVRYSDVEEMIAQAKKNRKIKDLLREDTRDWNRADQIETELKELGYEYGQEVADI